MRTTFCILLLAVGAGLLVTDLAPSQPPKQRPDGPPRNDDGRRPPMGMLPPGPLMEALDTNHDGILSADEIKNAPAALRKLDRNHDGKLTPDELRPARGPDGQPPRDGRRGGPDGQPPPRGGPDGQPPRDGRRGGPDGQPPRDGRPDGPPRGGRPGAGGVIPPFAREQLDLTSEQEKQIAELEKEVRARLGKILTDKQKKQMEDIMQRGPGGRPDGGNRRPPRDGDDRERPRRPDRPPEGKGSDKDRPRDGDRPPQDKEVQAAPAAGGIQWFATLDSGLREAQRTGRPILFLSAAPHCAGVSGIW